MKEKIVFTLFLSFFYLNFIIANDFYGWRQETPGGNEFTQRQGIKKIKFCGHTVPISHIKKWYFYKLNVIGIVHDDNRFETNKKRYFVLNENTCNLTYFEDESVWKEFLAKNKLNPKLTVRWYRYNWALLTKQTFVILVFNPWISLPILFLLFWIGDKSIEKEKFNLRKPFTKFFSGLILLFLVRLILDHYPMSF